jgi:molybdopterin-guanine dinucleotide biosynthesis protein A
MALAATLLLLAGGDSRRMGWPKALLPVGGATLLEWIAEGLAPEFEGLLVAAREPGQVPPGLRPHFVADLHPGAGPLAGIEAGLAATEHEAVFAVACDMPHVEPELARRLVAEAAGYDAAVPRVGGRPEPTCAAYRRSAAAGLSAALAAGGRLPFGLREALTSRYTTQALVAWGALLVFFVLNLSGNARRVLLVLSGAVLVVLGAAQGQALRPDRSELVVERIAGLALRNAVYDDRYIGPLAFADATPGPVRVLAKTAPGRYCAIGETSAPRAA